MSAAVPAGPVETGLARERTRLAWRRTALGAAVVALLTARLAADAGGALDVLAIAAALGGWVAVVALAHRRGRQVSRARPAPAGRLLVLCALATVAYALLGVCMVVTKSH
jgi:uncharacterized membrane protein YidH (DUF202 family)